MSPLRVWAVARLDLLTFLRRPLFWIWALLVTLLVWGLSSGSVTVQSGDASVGGTKAWITSEFHNAFLAVTLYAVLHMFFVAVAAGMTVIRDEELGVGPVLHSTRLGAGEYVAGKVLAVLLAFAAVLAVQIGAGLLFNHVLEDAESAGYVGPFLVANYLRPALLLTFPLLVFVAGASFLVGELSRRAVLVFLVPVAILGVFIFFTEWNPSWLSSGVRSTLQWTDPTGYRWLADNYLDEDRGVEFYNSARLAMDTPFLVSRLVFVGLGLAAFLASVLHFAGSLRGRRGGAVRKGRPRSRELERELTELVGDAPEPLAGLGMRVRPPGFVRGTLSALSSELRELRAQPGLYLFAPLIVLQVAGASSLALGAFETPLLWTPGQLAVGAFGPLRTLLLLLMLFYVVESLRRERATGFAAIHHATPLRTSSVLVGKLLANLFAMGFVLALLLGVFVAMLAYQGTVAFDPVPFALVWGIGLVPTLLLWGAFVTAVFAFTKNRFTTYGVALAALAWTVYRSTMGEATWVTNWSLLGALVWSDIGPFELDRGALVGNRIAALGGAVFFLALALRVWPRRDWDPTRILGRLRPRPLLLTCVRLLLFALVPLVALGYLDARVDAGFEGDAAEKWAKDYWRKNVATWTDSKSLDIASAVISVDLVPSERRYSAQGTLELVNRHDVVVPRVALTGSPEWESVSWIVSEDLPDPDNRAGLYVFEDLGPVEPGGTVTITYMVEGTHPAGFSKNGGGNDTFLLESGIVLTSFEPGFVPVVGYMPGIGVDEDNDHDSKQYLPDYFAGQTPSGFGQQEPHELVLTVTAPEAYRVNGPGQLVVDSVEDGVRTSMWQAEHPVTFFNIVAGRWDVREGEGTELWYHPAHHYNIEEMGLALDASRKFYAEWFREYPWETLKVSEFPGLDGYAQGFPTNITFSESIGFLCDTDEELAPAFFVTAHECGHQWWGNLLVPGDGPGGNILSEGMSHYSTMLLTEEVKGPKVRMELMRRLESSYNDDRQVDSEKPLVWIDGTQPGDTTVTYDKGGWVAWMLHHELGRDAMLAGLQSFIAHYEADRDHPVLQDLVAHLRRFVPGGEAELGAYDAFVQQWFFEVVCPEFVLEDVVRTELEPEVVGGPASWKVQFTLHNRGTGDVEVVVAAEAGERWPATEASDGADSEPATQPAGQEPEVPPGTALAAEVSPEFRDARTTVSVGAGERVEVLLQAPFEPERVVVDPDVMLLQLGRRRAKFDF